MDLHKENADKHIKNFSQFANQFTKVFIPIVSTALKMSADEPVSAYEVFNAAKNMAGSPKKKPTGDPKKKPNGTAKKKNAKKYNAKQSPHAKAGGKAKNSKKNGVQKSVGIKTNKSKNMKGKKAQPNQSAAVNKTARIYDVNSSELINLVEKIYTGDSKKHAKDEPKNQREPTAKVEEKHDTSFDSEGSEEEYTSFTESNSYSDVYSIDENGSFSSAENGFEEEFVSSNEADNQGARCLPEPRANKKRKSPENELTKTKSNTSVASTTSECKKSKNQNSKTQLHYFKSDNVMEPSKTRRNSMVSSEEISKKATIKTTSSNVSTASNVVLKPLSPPTNIVKLNSIEEGKRAFQWLLNPVTVDDFFDKYWEQNACLLKRNQSSYFSHLISFGSIDQMLLKNHVEFTKNIDVTSYKKGVRETLNPEGRALPPVVWDHYGEGCSIRLLNPQTFLPALFKLCTTMQEYFHCLVGTNAYLTPPNSQGFAPHYDDIEAFVLQIEGRKRWKLYKPRSTSEILPRYSSKNFNQDEIGKPILEEVLEPGDVLYFPRGTIHQASTEPGYHSLHITLSVYQKQSYADLFEKMLPIMLQKAIASDVELKRGLPLHTWRHAGIAYSDSSTKERADMTKKVSQLMHKFMRDLPLQEIMDAGVDQLAKKFQHEALPPEILPAEKCRTIFGSSSRTNERGECVCDYEIDERTNVRLLRANILRLVEEGEKICIYYYLDNSKEYCEYEPNFIEIERIEAASVEVLIKSYPQYVGVSQLPLPSDDEKIMLVTALWERGLLMMEKPFR